MADREKEDLVSVYRRDNTIFFYDELDRVSIHELESNLMDILKDRNIEEVNIVINSFGGHSCSIYDFIKSYPLPVNTYIQGYCCSSATTLYLAGDNRYISPTGVFLIHSYWGYVEESMKQGDAEDELHNTRILNELVLKQVYEKETKIPKSILEEKLKYEDRFLTPEECIKYKIAHEIKSFSACEE